MRIHSFRVINYRGVQHAEIHDLSGLGTVLLSGRNGTGKSLILEALAGAWAQRGLSAASVGPWSSEASIEITLALEEEELSSVSDWHLVNRGRPASLTQHPTYRISVQRFGGTQDVSGDADVINVLRDTEFQRDHPFAVMDLLAAHRQFQTGNNHVVDLGMFDARRLNEQRVQMLDQQIEHRNGMWLPDVGSYLVTLDYQAFLADRQQIVAPDDFRLIVETFFAATGKTIRRPHYDADRGGSYIDVALPSGPTHGLAELSNGEREMLALMYFVRRLSAAGGVLLIDEPEKHLHPSLQGALFEAMRGLAGRAQIVVVTHSPSLIAAAEPAGILTVSTPTVNNDNQLKKLADDTSRTELLATLGVTTNDLVQSDFMLIVEGEEDASALRTVFPVEVGRAHVVVAGGGQQVVSASSALRMFDVGIPWLAVRDRDLMSEAQIESLTKADPNLLIWARREVENLLLDPGLLNAATRLIRDEDLATTEANISSAVRELQEDVVEALTMAELRNQFPSPKMQGRPGRSNRAQAQMVGLADVLARRAEAYPTMAEAHRVELSEGWDQHWPALVDGKVALKVIQHSLGVFGSAEELKSVLLRSARDIPSLLPQELVRFRERVNDLLGV
jgi:predicted ATPase